MLGRFTPATFKLNRKTRSSRKRMLSCFNLSEPPSVVIAPSTKVNRIWGKSMRLLLPTSAKIRSPRRKLTNLAPSKRTTNQDLRIDSTESKQEIDEVSRSLFSFRMKRMLKSGLMQPLWILRNTEDHQSIEKESKRCTCPAIPLRLPQARNS